MAGSTFGKHFAITTYGESHGNSIGAIIDGCPSGLKIDEEYIQKFLDRRKPGNPNVSTPRKENDIVHINSGVFEGKTLGTPISLEIFNTNQHSGDYSDICNIYRPGHADFTFDKKFGFRDYRGGGRSSGRETAARVAGGAIATKILNELGIEIIAYTNSIGNIHIENERFDIKEINNNDLYMPDKDAAQKALELINNCKSNNDSIGGTVKVIIKNCPIGLGEPVFDKLDATLSHALFSIGAVKAVEIGIGTKASELKGSINNDEFYLKDEKIHTKTNNAGGILGGMSNGEDIEITIHFKPTPSISSLQHTVDCNHNEKDIQIKGRHDPVIVPRAVVVAECMCSITILDALMENMSSTMNNLKRIYSDNL